MTDPTSLLPGGDDRTLPIASTTVVGDYRLIRLLGEGTFGSVYEAVHNRTGLPYALKRLPPTDDPKRFEKEALYPARASRNSHYVLTTHSFFQGEDGAFYLATELIPHGDLGRFLKERQPLSITLAIELAIGIASGLSAIHKDGIVHLDLKPANILMDHKDDRWVPKIADFGLARSGGSIALNQHGSVGYASPEHFDTRATKDAASDMFSFGMLLYELLTGCKACDGNTVTEYAAWILKAVPAAPPSSRRPELEGRSDIDALLADLLQFDSRARKVTAGIAVTRLTECLKWEAPTTKVPVTPQASQVARPAAAAASQSNATNGKTLKVAVGVFGAVLLIGTASWALWPSNASDDDATRGVREFETQQYAAAFPLLLEEAQAGRAEAQRLLGRMYAEGLGAPENSSEAKQWLTRAVDQSDDEARCLLAGLWLNGKLGERSLERAASLFTDAAPKHQCGDVGLGDLAIAQGGSGSFDRALMHFEAAAGKGSTTATAKIAELHAQWPFVPLVRGAWQNLLGQERRDELTRLKASKAIDGIAGDIRRIRRTQLEFYDGGALYEVEIAPSGGGTAALGYVRQNDRIVLLNGEAAPIYQINETAPIRVDTLPRAASYLRFFMAAVQGPRGTFRVIDHGDDLAWLPSTLPLERTTTAQTIKPWQMEPSASGGWRAVGTVAYNRGLILTTLDMGRNGGVTLQDSKQLVANAPLLVDRFQPPGVRVTVDASQTH